MGLMCARASRLVGSVKSTLCLWVRQEAVREPVAPGTGLGTGRNVDQHPIRTQGDAGGTDERGTAFGSFEPWAEATDQAWLQAEGTATRQVSDDGCAIAAGIELVYGREAPRQLHLLREYRRNVGNRGFRAARALLGSAGRSEAREHARETKPLVWPVVDGYNCPTVLPAASARKLCSEAHPFPGPVAQAVRARS